MLVAVKQFKFKGSTFAPGDEIPADVDAGMESRLRWLLLDQRYVEQHDRDPSGWPKETAVSAAHSVKCDECEREFTTRRGLRYHKKSVHGQTPEED